MIYYITGGTRSGKSRYAQTLALELTDRPLYVATARRWDTDFEQRIQRHQDDRDKRWTSYEVEKQLSSLPLSGRVVVVDCVTLWLTNLFIDNLQDIDRCLEEFRQEVDQLVKLEAVLIMVSNELGMGMHAHTDTGRKFADLQGWANQYLAKIADKAILMVSGLPLSLKS